MPSTVLGSTQCLIYIVAHAYKIHVFSNENKENQKRRSQTIQQSSWNSDLGPYLPVHLLTSALSCIALQQAAALASCQESHGVCVIVGLLTYGVQLNIDGWLFFSGRSLKGSVFGGMDKAGKGGNLQDFGCGIIEKCVINASEGI